MITFIKKTLVDFARKYLKALVAAMVVEKSVVLTKIYVYCVYENSNKILAVFGNAGFTGYRHCGEGDTPGC
jgi:hypothetical protein